jgi:CPA1 family monovalent cation:H+ antiporter
VQIAWVFLYRASVERATASTHTPLPSAQVSFLTSWCGIRGILRIATASALPSSFPGRSLIVFAAFSVVLGTLVVQGFTIGPLLKLLHIEQDDSLKQEMEQVREELLHIGLDTLGDGAEPSATSIRRELDSALKQIGRLDFSAQSSGIDTLRRSVIEAQRARLIEVRDKGEIEEDVFQLLQEELNWTTLAASPADDLTLEEV